MAFLLTIYAMLASLHVQTSRFVDTATQNMYLSVSFTQACIF